MNLLTIIALVALLSLAAPASADVAKVAGLRKGESLVVAVHYEGTVPQVTHYTFTPGKVAIAEGGKNVGEVALTADEQAQVDRFLDLVRNGRHGRGNGASTYVLKFMKDGKERRGMGEKHRIRFPAEAESKVLPLSDLNRRAAK
jgi:hypothetical protein